MYFVHLLYVFCTSFVRLLYVFLYVLRTFFVCFLYVFCTSSVRLCTSFVCLLYVFCMSLYVLYVFSISFVCWVGWSTRWVGELKEEGGAIPAHLEEIVLCRWVISTPINIRYFTVWSLTCHRNLNCSSIPRIDYFRVDWVVPPKEI